MNEPLIKALQNPALYPHPVTHLTLMQTHLSWIILTGTFAYKIKKPLNLGFQDFTTLEKRKYYCELEFSLNKRLAPEIYIEIIAIGGSPENPQLTSSTAPIEYAIKMHEFPQDNLLSNLIVKQPLFDKIIIDLAKNIAHFHQTTEVDILSHFGAPKSIYAPMQDNFDVLKTLSVDNSLTGQMSHIQQWAHSTFASLEDLMRLRKQQGFMAIFTWVISS